MREEMAALLDDSEAYDTMARVVNPHSDGRASQRIVAVVLGRPGEPFARATQAAAGPRLADITVLPIAIDADEVAVVEKQDCYSPEPLVMPAIYVRGRFGSLR